MDASVFRVFARTAIELQSDEDTPRDYTMMKAAVEAKYGIVKQAASHEWIQKMTASGARKATPDRLARFINRRETAREATRFGSNTTPHDLHVRESNRTAAFAGINEQRYRRPFERPKTKIAWDSGELAGLATLATPSAANLAGHPMKERHKDIAEVAGLGTLAAPYAHNIAAKKSSRYAASGIGKRLSKAFGH